MNSTTQRRVARASLLLLVFSLAWAQTEALKPRASSTEYSARAGTNGVWIGVAVAPPHRDLVVLEVAVYPPPTGSANVTLNDFALSINMEPWSSSRSRRPTFLPTESWPRG